MPRHMIRCFVLVLYFSSTHAVNGQESKPPAEEITDQVSFNADIRPILADKCFACHGIDAKKRQADLRLDTWEDATGGGGGPQAIVPGQVTESELWRRITSDDPEEQMPPPATKKTVSQPERELLAKWISQGAHYQKHWAFEKPNPVQTPVVSPSNFRNLTSNPIDTFLSLAASRAGLRLTAEADRRIQIRRVSFVTTGLPPTPEEVNQFLLDTHPDAYARMVDRYLDSPHFGEEMARHWLDAARYADTHGMHLDNERQTWAYRDWVVNAFNRNLPFDQFTIEQLAGDLLPNPTQDQLIATGYNRCNVTSSEGGSIDAELLYRYAVDRTSTMFQTWTGLTAGCAVCHDHKFDPISQREFYSLYAFFYSAADPAMDGNALLTAPTIQLPSEGTKQKLAEFDRLLQERQQLLDDVLANIAYVDPALSDTNAQGKSSSSPEISTTEIVWLDDEYPAGGSVQSSTGEPTELITSEKGPVFSGVKSLKRSHSGIAQDVWDHSASTLVIPAVGKLFAYVYLDPLQPPRAIMLQYRTDDWKHRAVWGDYESIPFGQANSTERVHQGSLPTPGKWVRLEVDTAQLGLTAGTTITGFATTQFGGTVYWDKVGVSGTTDPALDPLVSFTAWWNSVRGKAQPQLPGPIRALADQEPAALGPDSLRSLRYYYMQHVCQVTRAECKPHLDELAQLQKQRSDLQGTIPSTFIFRDLEKPRDSFVMMRGAYDKPGERVDPDVPAILPPLTKSSDRANRLDLARWLVSPEHPLTARVAVNRFWQQVFGTGLVKTSYDFGTQGELPSHPQLLDWLALHFQSSGWNIKELMRLMLTTTSFRSSSQIDPDIWAKDPENRWLARAPRLRLDAEQIRDNALYVSGLLDLSMGGKGVRTYQPANIWEPVGFAGSNTRFYEQEHGVSLYRRSIYTFLKRTAPPPFMSNFDAPNREQYCARRDRSNTPLQALQLMNDVQHVEAARMLAQRMLKEGGNTAADRLVFAYQVVLARIPEPMELAILTSQLEAHHARYATNEAGAKSLVSVGESKADNDLLQRPIELASYTLVANTLLNLDETLNRN